MATYLVGKGERLIEVGKWWGLVKVWGRFEPWEIDVVIETNKEIYCTECKWTEQKLGESELNWLKESCSGT